MDVIYSKCNGKGEVNDQLCRSCYGKLSWIDNILGNNEELHQKYVEILRHILTL